MSIHWTDMGWSHITPGDMDILTRQLGRSLHPVVAVARRCFCGNPQVIVNDPLTVDDRGDATPFPTLFWLTCPYLVKAVDRLESEGWIARFRAQIRQGAWHEALKDAHEATARLRLHLCDKALLARLKRDAPGKYAVLAESGVAGMRQWDGVKCLHAHLADFLARSSKVSAGQSSVNPIGEKTATLLEEMGVSLDGDKSCTTCGGATPKEKTPV